MNQKGQKAQRILCWWNVRGVWYSRCHTCGMRSAWWVSCLWDQREVVGYCVCGIRGKAQWVSWWMSYPWDWRGTCGLRQQACSAEHCQWSITPVGCEVAMCWGVVGHCSWHAMVGVKGHCWGGTPVTCSHKHKHTLFKKCMTTTLESHSCPDVTSSLACWPWRPQDT